MSDIAAWLKNLGLSKFNEMFIEQEVDFETLSELTEQDLKDLNIPLGPRKKLLKAIAALAIDSTGIVVPPPPPTTTQAERRHLTVVFIDLVDSTVLSERYDPEELGLIIRAFQDRCAGIISRYGGYIAQYMGDGILAYFGYPPAHEDDAERALQAGLEITDAVSQLKPVSGLTLQSRVGIATGLVVVGEILTGPGDQSKSVVGETPNLASRLQALAEPDTVIVENSTKRLAGGMFEYIDLGHHMLKGFSAPVYTWRVKHFLPAESRYEAHNKVLTKLIGREAELGLLQKCWQSARDGRGQITLLAGEAGIGKSRIKQALINNLPSETYYRISLQCSAYHTDSALYPIIQYLKLAAGIEPDDSPDQKLDKLELLVRQADDDAITNTQLFATALSIPVTDRYTAIELSAVQRREKTIGAMVAQVLSLSKERPVLLVMEDAHWIDPSTALCLSQLMQNTAGQSVMILVTYRPPYSLPESEIPDIVKIPLERLDREQSQELARVILGTEADQAVVEGIVDRADGIPLYLEELSKSVAEGVTLKVDPTALDEVPVSLQALLVSRLDRLGLSRKLMQIGAVIGRTFTRDMIAAISDETDVDLERKLDDIVKSELMIRRGDGPRALYNFRHALIHDAAYETLLHRERRQYHARFADTLLQKFPDQADAEPGVLARHLSKARQPKRAVKYWLKAGQEANERSEYLEAITSFESGLDDLKAIEEQSLRNEVELNIRLALGTPLVAVKGWSARAVEKNYLRAQQISEWNDDIAKKIDTMFGLANVYFLRGEVHKTRELINRLLAIVPIADNAIMLMRCHIGLGMCSFFNGDFEVSRAHLQKAEQIYDPSKHALQKFSQGTDPAVIIQSMLAWTTWFLGDSVEAKRIVYMTLEYAVNLEHPFSLTYAKSLAASIFQCCEEPQEVLVHSESAITIAKEQHFPYWLGWASAMRGWAIATMGKPEKGIELLLEGLDFYQADGSRQIKPYVIALLAEAYGWAGTPEKGLEVLHAAHHPGNSTDVTFYEAEAIRIRGELERLAGISDGTTHFETASRLNTCQNSAALKMRVANSLDHALRENDHISDAQHTALTTTGDTMTKAGK